MEWKLSWRDLYHLESRWHKLNICLTTGKSCAHSTILGCTISVPISLEWPETQIASWMEFKNHFICATLLVLGVCCEWMTRGEWNPSLLLPGASCYDCIRCAPESWKLGCPHTWRATFLPCHARMFKNPLLHAPRNSFNFESSLHQLRAVKSPRDLLTGSLRGMLIRCWSWRLTSRMRILKILELRAQVLPEGPCATLQALSWILCNFAEEWEFHEGRSKAPSLSDCRMCVRKERHRDTNLRKASSSCRSWTILPKSFSSFVHELLLDLLWSALILFARSELLFVQAIVSALPSVQVHDIFPNLLVVRGIQW